MIILLFILVVCLYTFLIYSLVFKKYTTLTSTILVFICLYDWLFIKLSYYLPSSIIYPAKTYQEIIILLLLLMITARICINHKLSLNRIDNYFIFYIIIPFTYLLILTISSFESVELLIQGIRFFYIPIFFSYLLYKKNILHLDSRIIVLISVIVVTFAAYQSYSFKGDLSQLWFYDNFNTSEENPVDTGYFNYLKGEMLRATSFFVTSIDLSVLSALFSIYFLSKLFKKISLLNLFMFIWNIYGIYLSQTRMGLFVCIIGLLNFIFIKNNKGYKINKLYIILLPFGCIFLTMASLIFGAVSDLSAAGRLIQYIEFVNSFSYMGAGLSDYNAIFSYDSFFLCSFKMMGVLGILYFLFYIKLLLIIINNYNKRNHDTWDSTDLFIISSASAIIYVFAFHHLAGSIVQAYIFLLMFYSLSHNKSDKYKRINLKL